MDLPLNALRAFAVSARHLNFARAADELHLSPTAVSQHVKNLEARYGVRLFHRLPRGLALTDEGRAILPAVAASFDRLAESLQQLKDGSPRETLSLGVVATYAVGWLLPRLARFQAACPHVDLRLQTHNNRVDLAAEGLDAAIRFGDGHWHGTQAVPLLQAPLAPLCAPALALRLKQPQDLMDVPLLRSYRVDEWDQWCAVAGVPVPPLRGMVFDSSLALAEAAALGSGWPCCPPCCSSGIWCKGAWCVPSTWRSRWGATGSPAWPAGRPVPHWPALRPG